MNGRAVSKKELKTSYRASPRSIRPIYTGGPVLLTRDGRWLVSAMGEQVMITEVSTGESIAKVRGDTTAITSMALSYHTTPPTLITCHMSNAIRLYPLPEAALPSTSPWLTYTRQLAKAHSSPILVSASSPDSSLFATGSSDGVVKVWDAEGGYTTHIYRGHGGPVSALKFFFSEGKSTMDLYTGSADGKVRVFDLKDAASRVVNGTGGAAKAKAVLDGHVSVVRGIDVTPDGRYAITGGRDKVVLVWDMAGEGSGSSGSSKKGKGKAAGGTGPKVVQTIIAQEQVEALGLIPGDMEVEGSRKGRLVCYTGGDKGQVRAWDVLSAEQVLVMKGLEGVDESEDDEEEDDEQRGVVSIILDPTTSSLVSVHADQNIIYNSLLTGNPTRQIIGFNDDIIDATFLTLPSSSSASSHTHLALATNSSLIKVYSTSDFDSRLLSGHKDMVLCLDKSADYTLLVSGAKDQTARIWAPDSQGQWRCIAICEGHAESVGAVVFSKRRDERTGRPKFLVTASQDRTLKLWDLSTLDPYASEPVRPRSLATIRAHEKDINSLDISPNDKFLASGSQDKLVKIFEIDYLPSTPAPAGSLKLLGTCKGHRRGVWSVKFSKTDKIIASGAADKSVRLWSLDDLSCIKTLEGHTNSVLRVDFITQGMQLVTSSSDGLVKLWNIKDEECVKTLDNHEDKVWALAISEDEKTIVSAGADSVATFWEDSSEIEQAEKNEALIQAVQSEQDFTNYVALKDYRRAIKLALAMSQPGRLLNLFTTVASQRVPGTYTGAPEIDEVVRTLSGLDLARLLGHVRNWNANARTAGVAQGILHAVLRLRSPDDILKAFETAKQVEQIGEKDDEGAEEGEGGEGVTKKRKAPPPLGLRELLEGLLPYSERHYARVDRLVQDSYVLDYVVGEMDGGIFGGETMEVE